MANNKETVYLRGKGYWMKVLGDPVDNYNKDGKEWTGDLSLNDDALRQLKAIKIQGKPAFNIKDRDDERGQFITFKQKVRERTDPRTGEVKTTQPIKVIDAQGHKWPDNVKLGNGTVVDLKLEVVDYGKGMFPGIYPRAIRVLDHVPYEASEFGQLSEDDEYFKKPSVKQDDFPTHTADADEDLDDDIL